MTAVIIVLAVLFILFLPAFLRVTIDTEVRVHNHQIDFDMQLGVLGRQISLGGANKQQKNAAKEDKKDAEKEDKKDAEKKDKKDDHFKLRDILGLGSDVLLVSKRMLGCLRRTVTVSYFATDVLLALDDPFENGIAYGAVSGGMNLFYVALTQIMEVKECYLDISHDFQSGEGFLLNNRSRLTFRPASVFGELSAAFLKDKEFRHALIHIIKVF